MGLVDDQPVHPTVVLVSSVGGVPEGTKMDMLPVSEEVLIGTLVGSTTRAVGNKDSKPGRAYSVKVFSC